MILRTDVMGWIENEVMCATLEFLCPLLAVHAELRNLLLGGPSICRAVVMPSRQGQPPDLQFVLATWRMPERIRAVASESRRIQHEIQVWCNMLILWE